MTNQRPYSSTDLEEITARNETARRMIAGFAVEMPALAEFWRNLGTALADTPALWGEITRLNAELSTARLDLANLVAAVHATLAAYADGEADPLYYVRDELNARQMPSERKGRPS